MGGTIESLLTRSEELESELAILLGLRAAGNHPRVMASRQMYSIAFEHGCSVRILIATGNLTSAFGLVRLQHEALIRGLWLLLVASDESLAHISRDLSQESVERLPMIAEMIKSLRNNAPDGVMATLSDFAQKTLKPLNSFVHSGGHAYQRGVIGYPEALVRQILVASNGLQWLSAFEVANLADDANAAMRLYGIRTSYSDCLPSAAV